jgi:hypothetical protein
MFPTVIASFLMITMLLWAILDEKSDFLAFTVIPN